MCRLLVFSAALGFLYLLFSTLEHLLVVVGHLGHETLVAGDVQDNGPMPTFCGCNPYSESWGQTGVCCQPLEAFVLANFLSKQEVWHSSAEKLRRLISFDGISSYPSVSSLLHSGGELDDKLFQ